MPDPHLEVHPVVGLPEITAGDDLAALLHDAAHLLPGDVLVVSSKVVSKAAGLTRSADERDAVVEQQTRRVVASRRTPRGTASVVESVAGPVMAAAGVDASNTAAGTVLVLPPDADADARRLRTRMRELGCDVAVVVTDTAGRAWRTGQTDFALGCAGLVAVDDLRGTTDASGTVLEVTERALADEVAAAADLVKGKATGVPAAVVRGLGAYVTDDDGPGAAVLLRSSGDWFRLGHVEAVRAALGVPHGEVEVPSVLPEPVDVRLRRAVTLATHPGSAATAAVSADVVTLTGEPYDVGHLSARLLAALWAENLQGVVTRRGGACDIAVVSLV